MRNLLGKLGRFVVELRLATALVVANRKNVIVFQELSSLKEDLMLYLFCKIKSI